MVYRVTHALTFEYSITLVTGLTAATYGMPALRLAHAQGLADGEDDVLHVRHNAGERRVPVQFLLARAAAGVA